MAEDEENYREEEVEGEEGEGEEDSEKKREKINEEFYKAC